MARPVGSCPALKTHSVGTPLIIVLGCGIGIVGFWEGDEREDALGFNKDGSYQLSFVHIKNQTNVSPPRLSGPELNSPTGSDPVCERKYGRLLARTRGGS